MKARPVKSWSYGEQVHTWEYQSNVILKADKRKKREKKEIMSKLTELNTKKLNLLWLGVNSIIITKFIRAAVKSTTFQLILPLDPIVLLYFRIFYLVMSFILAAWLKHGRNMNGKSLYKVPVFRRNNIQVWTYSFLLQHSSGL